MEAIWRPSVSFIFTALATWINALCGKRNFTINRRINMTKSTFMIRSNVIDNSRDLRTLPVKPVARPVFQGWEIFTGGIT